jgi:hypothetical protein
MIRSDCRARLLAPLALLLTLATPAAAQSSPSSAVRPTYWGFVALGAGGLADSGFYASGIGGAVQMKRVLFMGRIASLDTKDHKRLEDIGLMVGMATRPATLHFGAAAGLGVAHDRDSSVIALPYEAQATWQFTRWAGIGARVFGGLSSLANYGGITVALQIGRLR